MAQYKVTDPIDYLAALDFINQAKEQGVDIELKYYSPKRSNPQNRYYHFICSYFAHKYGCTNYEAENVYMKQIAARKVFEAELKDKYGTTIRYFRSSADLDKSEMSYAISNFLAFAESNNIPIPYENDVRSIRICEREIEKTTSFGT